MDENQSRLENTALVQTGQIPDPKFWENHQIHYSQHTAWLKSPESQLVPPEIRQLLVRHVVLHARYVDPNTALTIATEEGIEDVIPALQQIIQSLQPPAPPEGAAPQPTAQPQEPAGGAPPPAGNV